jgi:hypothetical protein
MKQKKKVQIGRLKQTEIFKTTNSQYFFSKILWIGLGLVQLIDAKGIDVAQPIWP